MPERYGPMLNPETDPPAVLRAQLIAALSPDPNEQAMLQQDLIPKLPEDRRGNAVIVAGRTHPQLAAGIANYTGIERMPMSGLTTFPNGEVYVRYGESVRRKELVIVQTGSNQPGFSINDGIIETQLLLDAARRASVNPHDILLIEAFMPYGRADRMARSREAVSSKTRFNMLAGMIGSYATVDPHVLQSQANIDDPFDALTADPIILAALRKHIHDSGDPERYVVVSPDAGRLAVAENYAEALGLDVDFMPKRRDKQTGEITRTHQLQGLAGRRAILTDDMVDTAGTICSAAESLKRDSKVEEVVVVATHGILSNPALKRLKNSVIDRMCFTDTLPMDEARKALGDRLTVLPVAPLIGQATLEILGGGSISKLFNNRHQH